MPVEIQPVSDEELARQSHAGDFAAYEELVRRYESRVYGFLLQSCGNDADAREAAQDTFVRAFHAIGQFDAKWPFAAWLFAIARRKGIDCFRARIPGIGQCAPEPLDEDDPGELLARNDEARFLWGRARALLPLSQFQSLWLRYVEDMKVAEIARVLGKTQTSIKVLLFRARQRLAADLQAAHAPPSSACSSNIPATARQGIS